LGLAQSIYALSCNTVNTILRTFSSFNTFYSQFQKILDDSSAANDGEKYLAALTAGERVPWAQARKKYFAKGLNKSSLDAIEKVRIFFFFKHSGSSLIVFCSVKRLPLLLFSTTWNLI
jgi:hypothetical protein